MVTKSNFRLYCSVFLFLIIGVSRKTVSAQKKFSIINYTTKNGLPENNIQSMLMDSAGFLWTSYANGLLRFDGNNFRKFLSSPIPYTNLFIYKTLKNETLIIDASGSVFELKNQKVDTLRLGKVNSLNYIIAKGIIPSKKFYFKCTTPHINKGRDKNWFYPPMTIFPLGESGDCMIRCLKGIGLYHFNERQKELNLEEYSPKHFISIHNNVYFFSSNNQMYWIDVKNWVVVPVKIKGDILNNTNFFKNPSILTNTFWDYNNSDPCLLAGYDLYHLFIENDNPIVIQSTFVTNEVPRNCLITSLIYSSKNNLLALATDTKGLFVFREQKFRLLTYNNPEPGTNNAYYCQLELDSNTLYTDWNREFNLNGGYKSKLPIKKNYSENIFRDSHGNLWYMLGEDALKSYNPKDKSVKNIYNPSKEFVLCYFEEGDSIWVGSSNSIGYIKNDTLHNVVDINNNGSNSNLFQVQRWKENKIWFCNYTGIFAYDQNTHKIDTLQAVYQKYSYNFNIFKDYMIIGTYGRGFYFYKDGKTVHMPEDPGHNLQQSYVFVHDSSGYTWIATNNGIYKTRFSDLENYFRDTTYKVSYLHYGEEDGITSPEFNGGCVPSYLTLKNGYTSIPNVEGLIWFKTDDIKDIDFSHPFINDGIYLDDSLVTFSGDFKINSSIQSVRIDFTTPYWGTQENLFLEYKLEGFNKQWTPLNISQRSVEFNNLKSGSYAFLLRKKNGFEPGNYVTQSFQFYVEKKFYETGLFILLIIITAVGFVVAVARLYAYNIKKKNILLEESVKQRTLELSRANTDLQQSVNVKDKLISIISHDIVTPLRFITMVAGKGADKKMEIKIENAQAVLSEIKNTSEKLHDNAQNILNWIKYQNNRININKTNVAVSALADDIADMLKEMAGNKGTVIVNSVSDEDIIQTDKNILSIILHNLISNSTKFTSNGTIRINATYIDKKYMIVVEDSGKGMAEEQLKRVRQILSKEKVLDVDYTAGQNGYGLGYVIIGELIELLKGTISIESIPGVGTKVILLI